MLVELMVLAFRRSLQSLTVVAALGILAKKGNYSVIFDGIQLHGMDARMWVFLHGESVARMDTG